MKIKNFNHLPGNSNINTDAKYFDSCWSCTQNIDAMTITGLPSNEAGVLINIKPTNAVYNIQFYLTYNGIMYGRRTEIRNTTISNITSWTRLWGI